MGSSSPDTEGMSISCRANSTGRNPSPLAIRSVGPGILRVGVRSTGPSSAACRRATVSRARRSEEHTSELQSRLHLVCRLLLEKKKEATVQCAPARTTAPPALTVSFVLVPTFGDGLVLG